MAWLLEGVSSMPEGCGTAETGARLFSADGLLVAGCHRPHLLERRQLTDNLLKSMATGPRPLAMGGATARPVRTPKQSRLRCRHRPRGRWRLVVLNPAGRARLAEGQLVEDRAAGYLRDWHPAPYGAPWLVFAKMTATSDGGGGV
jgi:hypothetical protein